MNLLKVYTDGASRGNPGPASIGIVFKNENNEIVWEQFKEIGKKTNNEAEYEALIYAMKHVNRHHPDKIQFYSDSELMISQMNGKYAIKEPKIQKLFLQAWNKKISLNKKIEFISIPREQNKEADKLANKALDQKSLGL